ncbi:TPA: hypothetical protein N3515_003227 [Klebsiella quasipneumoniae]|nr:hypothetical protein [Klebsiella quasipneumoniae]
MKQTIFILAMSIFPVTVFSESTLISPMIGGIDICQSAIKKELPIHMKQQNTASQ